MDGWPQVLELHKYVIIDLAYREKNSFELRGLQRSFIFIADGEVTTHAPIPHHTHVPARLPTCRGRKALVLISFVWRHAAG